jgi:hypothetical protein
MSDSWKVSQVSADIYDKMKFLLKNLLRRCCTGITVCLFCLLFFSRQKFYVPGVSVDMIEEEKWSVFAPSPSAMKEARSIIDELLEDKPVRIGNRIKLI